MTLLIVSVMCETMRNQPLASALICLFLLRPHPEALLKQRTPPSTRRTPSARSGSLSTFPFDLPQTCKHKDLACQPNLKRKI